MGVLIGDEENQLKNDEKNLWKSLLGESCIRSRIPYLNVVMVGGKSSGKKMLLKRILSFSNSKNSAVKKNSRRGKQLELTSLVPAFSSFEITENNKPKISSSVVTETKSNSTADDVIADVGFWVLNDQKQKNLLKFALKPEQLRQSVAVVVLDYSQPWLIEESLTQWVAILEEQIKQCISYLPLDEQEILYQSIQIRVASYEEPTSAEKGRMSKNLSPEDVASKIAQIPANVLIHNLGIPLVVVACKTDVHCVDSVKADYIQHYLRSFCLKYGASLFYTCASTGKNCEMLRNYLLSLVYPTELNKSQLDSLFLPQVIENDSLFVPSGYDSYDLLNQSLIGSEPRWDADQPFHKIISTPRTSEDTDNAFFNAEVKVDEEQIWLDKLEKAGAAASSTVDVSIETRRRVSEKISTRLNTSDSRKASLDSTSRHDKDVNPAHLANFFNNLLSRQEKGSGKSSSSRSDKSKKFNLQKLDEESLAKNGGKK